MTLTPADLDALLDDHDALIAKCLAGRISFQQFLAEYDSFYWRFALDGHESDDEERDLLSSRAERIRLHRDLDERILSKLAADSDALKPEYVQAGRIGSAEAFEEMTRLVAQAKPSFLATTQSNHALERTRDE